MWPGLWRTALASAMMGVALVGWLALAGGWPAWLVAGGGVAGGGLVFAAAAYGLGCPEARLFSRLAWERLRRRRPAA